MCSCFFRSRARGCPGAHPTAAMAPSPSTPAQRARGCRQAGSHITPDTPETKPLSGEKDSSKKSKRTLSEVGTSPAKKAKVEPQQIEPPAGANSTEPPATEAKIEIEPPAGANSTEPPATEAKIENAEQPGDNMHLQSVTPAGANLPTPPQLPQSPASDGARTVIDDLEDTQVSQDSQVSQCEATDKSDSKVSQCEVADKLDKRKKHTLMVQTQNWLEDSSKGNGEQVGVGIYSSQYLLDQVLDPVMIMKGVWKELIPRINKLLQFNEPLQFGSNDDGERAYCAAWNKDHAKSAFRGPGFYLSATCLHWFDLQEQPGEFASWRNVMTCATTFFPSPIHIPRT